MGFRSKQVSRDGVGWSQSLLQSQTLELPKASATKRQQHQQNQKQQTEEVKCPRCDSSNTKFCYYNNYNKSQPRHLCKACKRHWTIGGTLRNVPVGGGRKNKRIKTSNTNKSASASAVSATTPAIVKSSSSSGSLLLQQNLDDHRKNVKISNLQFRPPSSLLLQQNSVVNCSSTSNNNGVFSFPDQTSQGGLQFPFSISTSTSTFETTPSSISTSFQSQSIYNFAGETLMEDPTTTTACGGFSLPWQLPITSSDIDMANYWNWDEIDALVSTTDFNVSWDDTEIKP